MDEILISALSLVKSSDHRKEVVKSIGLKIYTPAEISKGNNMQISHVSMYLTELKRGGIVECLNETAKKGRLYRLTPLGKKVLKCISES